MAGLRRTSARTVIYLRYYHTNYLLFYCLLSCKLIIFFICLLLLTVSLLEIVFGRQRFTCRNSVTSSRFLTIRHGKRDHVFTHLIQICKLNLEIIYLVVNFCMLNIFIALSMPEIYLCTRNCVCNYCINLLRCWAYIIYTVYIFMCKRNLLLIVITAVGFCERI